MSQYVFYEDAGFLFFRFSTQVSFSGKCSFDLTLSSYPLQSTVGVISVIIHFPHSEYISTSSGHARESFTLGPWLTIMALIKKTAKEATQHNISYAIMMSTKKKTLVV